MALEVETKMSSTDRILVLKVKEGGKAQTTKGMTDNSLFTGGNKLHAIMDPQTTLWRLKYERGVVPPQFDQHFTNFNNAFKFAKDYYSKRDIEVTDVIHATAGN